MPGERRGGGDASDDGALIFCGISLVLALFALWAAAFGHGDMFIWMY